MATKPPAEQKALEVQVVQPGEVAAPQTGHVTSMVEVIARAAADPNTDVSKMERLYAMLKEENARIAEQRFNAAMTKAQAEMPMVVKRATNPSTNSKYAKLETIAKAIAPILEKYKFSLKFSEGESPNPAKIRILCKVSHDAGDGLSHSEEYHLDLSPDDKGMKGSDTKTKIHGEGSTLNYGRRYLTTMIFNLTIIGEDDDGNQGQRPRPAGPSTMRPPSEDLKPLATELWIVLKSVRGDKDGKVAKDWDAANAWLWKEEILDPAVPGLAAPNLTAEQFRETIKKAKDKLGVK
jgi:hypothetical protein